MEPNRGSYKEGENLYGWLSQAWTQQANPAPENDGVTALESLFTKKLVTQGKCKSK